MIIHSKRLAKKTIILVICHVPNKGCAQKIAQRLLEEKLAACINILSPCQSLYYWDGAIKRVDEIPLWIKTSVVSYPQLEKRLLSLHPYDTPEIIACPITQGLDAYFDWIRSACVSSLIR